MKRRLLFHFFFISVSYHISDALYMLRGLLLAKLFGPTVFGVWASMRLVMTLSQYTHFGAHQAMVQLAPLAEGRGEHDRATLLRRVASGMTLGSALIPVLIVAAMAQFILQGDLATAWKIFAAILLLIHLYQYYQTTLRSHQKFVLTGMGQMAVAALTTILGYAAAVGFGLIGFLVVMGLAHVVVLFGLLKVGPVFPKPLLRREPVVQLIRVGFPLMASQFLFILLWNVDKLLLWFIEGSAVLGKYVIQASFTNFVLLMPAAIATVLHPHLMRHLGQSRSVEAIRPYLERGGPLLAVWSGPIIGLGFLTLHLPIRWWLSQYTAAIEPGRILMLGAFFTMIGSVSSTVLISLSGQGRLCLIRAIAVAVAAIGGVTALKAGMGFNGVAIATSAGLVVNCLLELTSVCHRAQLDRRAAIRLTVGLFAPYALLIGSLALAMGLIPDAPSHWQNDLTASIGRCAIVGAFVLPWALWRSRKLTLLEDK